MTRYTGSCHCGTVTFAFEADVVELVRCNCSLCDKRHVPMVPISIDQLTVLTGEDNLARYQWNTKRARHFFCKTCGIYTFHSRRSRPDQYSVNAYCVDDFDFSNLSVTLIDGRSFSLVEDEESGAQQS